MKRTLAITALALLSASIAASGALAGNSSGSGKPTVKTGHYEGASAAGRPIAFDVAKAGKRVRLENLAIDVETECWSDVNLDGLADTLIAHVFDLAGKVTGAGEVEVFYSPDDDTEYVVEGTIKKGVARLNAVIGGSWDYYGMHSAAGPLQCDNWGETYTATRR